MAFKIQCAYTCPTDSSFARERRAKPSQSPYLPEMIRFESAVSHDNRTYSTGRLRDHADVSEKVLHTAVHGKLRFHPGFLDFAEPKHVYECVSSVYGHGALSPHKSPDKNGGLT
ncbi:hypothetical protein ALC62_01455 [Cyphomyrmex costatus]|uniref:Uncharacterized protein n=1 Tax=Cyphomyrmex costatus TaxID=456900 RepID=A0A195D406_9HYME|nr:hypothetical protein ALC62_01455 [Cyphomyrmex costatus]